MKIVEFKDLYFTDFQLSSLVAINKTVENNQLYAVLDDSRTTSVLVYLKDCSIRYILADGSTLDVPKGSIVYIPHTAKYHVNYRSQVKSYALAQLAAFELHDENGKQFIASENIQVVCSRSGNAFADSFDEAVELCDSQPFSYSAFKAVLYSIISEISRQHMSDRLYTGKFYSIAPSVNYLKKNPNPDISISELAEMSHISESCFRRLFKKQFGVSPSEYLLSQKIKKAKKLLQGNMYSVGEVSQLLGYSDPAYFSKVFKKETGTTPGKYRENFEI